VIRPAGAGAARAVEMEAGRERAARALAPPEAPEGLLWWPDLARAAAAARAAARAGRAAARAAAEAAGAEAGAGAEAAGAEAGAGEKAGE